MLKYSQIWPDWEQSVVYIHTRDYSVCQGKRTSGKDEYCTLIDRMLQVSPDDSSGLKDDCIHREHRLQKLRGAPHIADVEEASLVTTKNGSLHLAARLPDAVPLQVYIAQADDMLYRKKEAVHAAEERE